MKRAIFTLAVTLATAGIGLSSTFTHAGDAIYRWTDERGDPVNSDRPPPKGVDYEVVSTYSSMARSVDGDEGAVPPEVKPSASNEFEPVDTSTPKFEKNPEFCQRAKDNLQALDTSARIRLRNEQGEFRYINEEEKQEQRAQAQNTIDIHCE